MKYFFKSEKFSLINKDCREVLHKLPEGSVDMIFADPPYFLSNGGFTCKNGKRVSVNKGKWDESNGFDEDTKFHESWLKECDRVLKEDGSIWISGTYHCIYQIGYILLKHGYAIINDVSWYKPNASPNLSCRMLTASHETLIWAKKKRRVKHYFDYKSSKEFNNGKQLRTIWTIPTTPKSEKIFGKHPTQKPLKLTKRIIKIATKKGDVVLDPFCGSSSIGVSAVKYGRKFIGIDIDKKHLKLSKKRIMKVLGKGVINDISKKKKKIHIKIKSK